MKPYTTATALSNKAEIFQKADRSDVWGNPVWESLGVCWCSVRDRLGNETLENAQNKRVSHVRTTFTFRSHALTQSITPAMRIVWRGQTFNILSGPVYTDDRNFVQFEGERFF